MSVEQELSQEELKEIRSLYDDWSKEVAQEVLSEDPVARECTYICFESYSKGKGKRKRRFPSRVELIGRGGQFVQIRDGYTQATLDDWAQELLPDVLAENQYEEFLKRVRKLSYLRNI